MSENVITSTTRSRRYARRVLLIAMALLATLLTQVSPVHAANDPLQIDGAGWGHTIGLSQYGAYAHALAGESYLEILEFYYDVEGQDVTTVVADPVGEALWLGLEQEAVRMHLKPIAIVGGGVPATLAWGSATDSAGALAGDLGSLEVPVGSTIDVVFADGSCTYAVGAGDASDPMPCNFDLTWDGWDPNPTGAIEFDKHWEFGSDVEDGGDATNCSRWGNTTCTYDYGTIVVRPDNNRGFDLSLIIDFNDYVTGIGEVPASWHAEALKAQAVAARTFARYQSNARMSGAGASTIAEAAADRSWCWCTLYDSSSEGASGKVNDQVYRGRVEGVTVGGVGQNWKDAAIATDDEVVLYNGEPILAVYGSSNGGATQNNEDIWQSGSPIPYLRSRPDPLTLSAPGNPYPSWSYNVTTGILESRLGLDEVYEVTVAETYASGTASRIVVAGLRDGAVVEVDEYGGKPLDGVRIQAWYGLRSPHVTGFGGDLPEPGPIQFTDIEGNTHAGDIEYLAALDAAFPCAEDPYRFCPDDRMRREDLAAFMVAALDLPPTSTDYFDDDDGLPFEDAINSLAEAGITKGCNPPANTEFCPDDTVTRGQTAAFIVRAWELTDAGPGDWFSDDDGNTFELDIDKLATAGITKGCNPPDNTWYCPDRLLSRAEMSSFLARALRDLIPS